MQCVSEVANYQNQQKRKLDFGTKFVYVRRNHILSTLKQETANFQRPKANYTKIYKRHSQVLEQNLLMGAEITFLELQNKKQQMSKGLKLTVLGMNMLNKIPEVTQQQPFQNNQYTTNKIAMNNYHFSSMASFGKNDAYKVCNLAYYIGLQQGIDKCYKIILLFMMSEPIVQQKEAQQLIQQGQSLENQFFSDPISEVEPTPSVNAFAYDQNIRKGTAEKQSIINIFERKTKPQQRQVIRNQKLSLKDNDDASSTQIQSKDIQRKIANDNNERKINPTIQVQSLKSQVILQESSLRSGIVGKTKNNQHAAMMDPKLLEAKINEIAKSIRNKVKKNDRRGINNEQMSFKRGIKIQGKEQLLNPLKLTPLPNNHNQNVAKNLTNYAENKLLTFQESNAVEFISQNPYKFIKQFLRKQMLEKVFLSIEVKSNMRNKKLKLDPINHHYPMTSFRKIIIQELKSHNLREFQKEKARQVKLTKRRDIYNTSRYQRYAKMGSILQRSLYQEISKQAMPVVSQQNPQTFEAAPIDAKVQGQQEIKQKANFTKQQENTAHTRRQIEVEGTNEDQWNFQ